MIGFNKVNSIFYALKLYWHQLKSMIHIVLLCKII